MGLIPRSYPLPVGYEPFEGVSTQMAKRDHSHTIEVEDWITVLDADLENGWTNPAGGQTPFRFLKDPMGFVHIEGKLDSGTTAAGTRIYTLPVGYRPSGALLVPVLSNFGLSRIPLNIELDGDLTIGLSAAANNMYFSIIFEADREQVDFTR